MSHSVLVPPIQQLWTRASRVLRQTYDEFLQ